MAVLSSILFVVVLLQLWKPTMPNPDLRSGNNFFKLTKVER
jgi:hypothetical protein